MLIQAIKRQIASKPRVNKIRDFKTRNSEGVGEEGKHASNVHSILGWFSGFGRCSGLRRCSGLGAHHFADAALASIFARADALNACALTVSFFGQLAVAQNFDAISAAIGQTCRAQRRFIHRARRCQTGSNHRRSRRDSASRTARC